jgi:hypothetical protein
MSGAVLVAIAASIGNLLQGWDNATIAGNLVLSVDWFCQACICRLSLSYSRAYISVRSVPRELRSDVARY